MGNKIWFYSNKIPPDHSGSGNRCVEHSKWFADLGYDTSILTNTNNANPVENVRIIPLKKARRKNIITQFSNLLLVYSEVRKAIKEYGKPDIIHLFGSEITTYPLTKIGRKYDIKTIVEATITLPANNLAYSLKPNKYIRKSGLKKADVIVAISEGVKESIYKHGVTQEIQVINNGVDMNRFSWNSSLTKKELREKLNLPVDSILLLMIGRVCLRKGHDIALKVLNRLSKKRDVILVAVGPYSEKELNDIKSTCTEEEIELLKTKKVLLMGKHEHVEDFYKACDVYLFLSRKEGFGNVLVEAMASKIPIIASKIEGITDNIIEHNETGYIVESDNLDFIKFIELIVDDNKTKESLINKAFDSVRRKFDRKIIYKIYNNIYISLF